MQKALELSHLKTKKEIVREALKNYIALMKRRELLSLRGRVTWDGNLKEMRSICKEPLIFDTSVWIDFFRNEDSEKSDLLASFILRIIIRFYLYLQ